MSCFAELGIQRPELAPCRRWGLRPLVVGEAGGSVAIRLQAVQWRKIGCRLGEAAMGWWADDVVIRAEWMDICCL